MIKSADYYIIWNKIILKFTKVQGLLPAWKYSMAHAQCNGSYIMHVVSLQAIAFIEPFSYYFKEPLGSHLYQTVYSEQSPKCVYPGVDYGHFYSMLSQDNNEHHSKHSNHIAAWCSISPTAQGFGHCDILNEINWESELMNLNIECFIVVLLTGCHLLHFCKTNKTNNRSFYHSFVSGVMTSFYGSYLQYSTTLLQYSTWYPHH